jgi:hypothetical protein
VPTPLASLTSLSALDSVTCLLSELYISCKLQSQIPKTTLQAMCNKDLNASAPVTGLGTNDGVVLHILSITPFDALRSQCRLVFVGYEINDNFP